VFICDWELGTPLSKSPQKSPSFADTTRCICFGCCYSSSIFVFAFFTRLHKKFINFLLLFSLFFVGFCFVSVWVGRNKIAPFCLTFFLCAYFAPHGQLGRPAHPLAKEPGLQRFSVVFLYVFRITFHTKSTQYLGVCNSVERKLDVDRIEELTARTEEGDCVPTAV